MSNRSLKLTIALFAGALFSSLVDAQEMERSSVNFNNGVLYSWPAYVDPRRWGHLHRGDNYEPPLCNSLSNNGTHGLPE